MEKQFYNFVKEVYDKQLGVEGIAIADGEKILMEHHFTPDQARNIYSHTKSYMSTAVGLAIADGKLSLDDRLAEFFPEAVPENAQPELFEIRLRHLLMMSSGFHEPYLMGANRRAGVGVPDYVKYMLSRPVKVQPGSEFVYSTADSILAGRMVEKAVGKRLSEYLYERFFEPLGQGFPIWENCPQGHPIGGGGMFMTLSNMLKIGQVYLMDGKWKGQQLVDPAWIKEATAKQIETPNPGNDIWVCGYGYQFWRNPYEDSYRADGAYGQLTMVLPKKGLIVAIQCPESGDLNKVKPVMHELNFVSVKRKKNTSEGEKNTMEYSAIFHDMDKRFCYAIEKDLFVIRVQVKKDDMKEIILHYEDKYIPMEREDTRKTIVMKKVATSQFNDYYEAQVRMHLICLRYFFEFTDMQGEKVYYGNYEFDKESITNRDRMFDCPQNLREEEMFEVPEWAANKVVYQIFPSRFAASQPIDKELWYKAPITSKDNLHGDLRGIIDHLDHIQKLGIDVVYLTPIFKSDSCHKYDTTDYYQIDPSFGTTEDLKELVQKAHECGMKVVMDAVFNHTGRDFFSI